MALKHTILPLREGYIRALCDSDPMQTEKALETIRGLIFRGRTQGPGGTVDVGFRGPYAHRFHWVQGWEARYLFSPEVDLATASLLRATFAALGWEVEEGYGSTYVSMCIRFKREEHDAEQ